MPSTVLGDLPAEPAFPTTDCAAGQQSTLAAGTSTPGRLWSVLLRAVSSLVLEGPSSAKLSGPSVAAVGL